MLDSQVFTSREGASESEKCVLNDGLGVLRFAYTHNEHLLKYKNWAIKYGCFCFPVSD